MRTIMTNTLFAAASAALTTGALLFSVPASAADVLTRHSQVRYADLDLGNAADRATLNHRIRQAAYAVCITDTDIAGQAASARCRSDAIADATRRMDVIVAQTATTKRVALR